MKRAGFTMIELIFVIVILGILAAVAIPKLAATRDDAELAARATQIQTVINEVGAYAVATNRYNTIENMSVAAGALINAADPQAVEATGALSVFDVRNASNGAACVVISQATRPWTGDAATDEAAAITAGIWTDLIWDNGALTKIIEVTHPANALGSCDILQDKIPVGWTVVKGRAAQF